MRDLHELEAEALDAAYFNQVVKAFDVFTDNLATEGETSAFIKFEKAMSLARTARLRAMQNCKLR